MKYSNFVRLFFTLLLLLFFSISVYFLVSANKSIATSDTKERKQEEDKYQNARERALQEFQKTIDPKTRTVPTNRLLAAKKEIQRLATAKAIGNVNWVERGPSNVGGRTRALLFDQNDASNNTVFAAGVSGGLWKSTNFQTTATWTPVNDFFQNIAITAIIQHPTTKNVLYFGTGEGFDGDIRGLGIWKSTDSGQTWSQLASTNNATFHFVQDLLFDTAGNLYATTAAGGVQRSTNAGASWTGVRSGDGADLELGADGTIYATMGVQGNYGYVYKSTTGNAGSWVNITPPVDDFERIELAVAPSDANRLYALCEGLNSDDVTYMYRSENKGNTWTALTVPTICDQGDNSPFTRDQAWYDLIAVVNPTNADQVYIGGIDMLRSNNKGATWKQISKWTGEADWACSGTAPNYVHADHHMYVFEPGSSQRIVLGTDGGLFHSTNINASLPTYTTRNNGYRVTQFYSCAVHPAAGSNFIIGGTQDNGSHSLNSATLGNSIEVAGGDGGFCHIDQDNPSVQIVSYTNNDFYVSTDGGNNFEDISKFTGGSFINPTDYDDTANILYAAQSSGKFLRWPTPAASVTTSGVPTHQIVTVTGVSGIGTFTHVAVSPNTANQLYLGDDNGNVIRVSSAHSGTSRAGIGIFNYASITNSSESGSISCIAIEKGNENHILITLSNYGLTSVWETTNGGTTWTNVENNLPDMPIRWALFNPLDGDQAFLATEMGVWSTDDLNGTATDWTVTSMGLANVRVDMLQYRESDKLIAAATHGRGIFTTIDYGGITSNCTAVLEINNSSIPSNTYTAGDIITSTGTVASGSDVTFDATNSITLQSGFHAVTGSQFLAKIGGCTASVVADETPLDEVSRLMELTPTILDNTALEFALYPSPAASIVTIDFFLTSTTETVITLHNSTGGLVKILQQRTNLSSGQQQFSFNANTFEDGLYFVVMSTPKSRKSQKLMIVRN